MVHLPLSSHTRSSHRTVTSHWCNYLTNPKHHCHPHRHLLHHRKQSTVIRVTLVTTIMTTSIHNFDNHCRCDHHQSFDHHHGHQSHLYCCRVPDQEDSALPLPHQQVRRVLPRHCPKVPAEKWGVSQIKESFWVIAHTNILNLIQVDKIFISSKNCGSKDCELEANPPCEVILFWSKPAGSILISEQQFYSHQRTNVIILRRCCRASQRSGQDRQIPFPHFWDQNFQFDFNSRCCEFASVCLYIRNSRLEMMMLNFTKSSQKPASSVETSPLRQRRPSTELCSTQHQQRPKTHEAKFLRQWMTIWRRI